jgi:3-oxoacyl-[acyl-carrier protein] reductase
MKSQKFGKIISILTSYVVGKPPNGITDYVVGKYSLLGLTKCMAAELGSFGIRANSVSPSIVNTPLTDPLPNKLKEITKSQIPLENRLAEPSEVAEVVLFLCGDGSNYITGENILVTGGYTMH